MARVPPVLRGGVKAVALILLVGTIVIGIGWLIRQLQRLILRESLNVPKYLFLAAAIPMHWVALVTPMPAKPIALVAILTIYHNLQYHRLIWFHNQKYSASDRGSSPTVREGAKDSGRMRVPHSVPLHSLVVASSSISRWEFSSASSIRARVSISAISTFTPAIHRRRCVPVQLGIAFLWGYAFIHYYLDSKIWRVRRDPSVGQALKMS